MVLHKKVSISDPESVKYVYLEDMMNFGLHLDSLWCFDVYFDYLI